MQDIPHFYRFDGSTLIQRYFRFFKNGGVVFLNIPYRLQSTMERQSWKVMVRLP